MSRGFSKKYFLIFFQKSIALLFIMCYTIPIQEKEGFIMEKTKVFYEVEEIAPDGKIVFSCRYDRYNTALTKFMNCANKARMYECKQQYDLRKKRTLPRVRKNLLFFKNDIDSEVIPC